MRVIRLSIFSLSLIFLSLWGLHANAAAWVPVNSSAGGFSVMMPGTPQLQETTHSSFVGAIEENTYSLKTDNGAYSVEYSNLPSIAVDLGGANTIFDKAKKGLLKETSGSEMSFNEISLNGSPGKELAFQIPAGAGSTSQMGKAQFFLVKKRLYVLVATSTQSDNFSQFFGSFKLLSP